MRDLAPSDELRRWYGHDPRRFGEFRRRYLGELESDGELLRALRRRARGGTLTNGASRARTGDLWLAKPALFQLSYGPF